MYRSRMVHLKLKNGRTVAWFHARLADVYGNVPAHVWPDPKYIFREGTRYRFSTEVCTKEPCACRRS